MNIISSIKWTDESIEHIAKHAVKPNDVEEVCFNEYETPLVRKSRQNLHYIFGKTYSGRYLFIVVRFIRRGEVKIITARDMNGWEKDYFRKRGK
ncbi:BrnT family toxin [Candidatus Desantisbacteria bacterium]|nr:BrnT family toxin [Candidatus Desantisbacteria bacterium]